MKKILLNIKKYLYVYVAIDFILALIIGMNFDMQSINIRPISLFAVFMMLYPMLTGMVVEKVKKAGKLQTDLSYPFLCIYCGIRGGFYAFADGFCQ